eukprot:scaffold29802_cov107-Isochrysis_galbana.AAC.3
MRAAKSGAMHAGRRGARASSCEPPPEPSWAMLAAMYGRHVRRSCRCRDLCARAGARSFLFAE